MKKLNTITVGELMDVLENYDRDTKVVMAADAHDHCHQTLANTLGQWDSRECTVAYSEYFRQFIVPKQSSLDDDYYEDTEQALVLGSLSDDI